MKAYLSLLLFALLASISSALPQLFPVPSSVLQDDAFAEKSLVERQGQEIPSIDVIHTEITMHILTELVSYGRGKPPPLSVFVGLTKLKGR